MNLTEHGPVHHRYSTRDEYTTVSTWLDTFYVIKETEKGFWIVPAWAIPLPTFEEAKKYRRWVSKDSRKRFCYPTKEEAWESYKIRCSKRIGHLKDQLAIAEAADKLQKPTDHVKIHGRPFAPTIGDLAL